ncbi:hypothetical protein, partial [Oceanobacter antarcticus]
PETATLQERYHSILQNCRRLNGINVLLKRSILDNWVENYRKKRRCLFMEHLFGARLPPL